MPNAAKIAAALTMLVVVPASFLAQTKRKPKTQPKAAAQTATPQPTPEATPKTTNPPKRNERPGNGTASNNPSAKPPYVPVYFYRFERPGFVYPSIAIEHDEAGKGQITFVKDGNDIAIADPIELSAVTMTNLKNAFAALNFLDSNENYQYPRDYSNLGNVIITVQKDGRRREVKYNWTDNKHAKFLADEYRRISNEYIWRFEIVLARDNQPLSAPGLIDQMDDYLKRQEISDPFHMVPILRELANDERIPLIARNHAAKLAASIEKQKK